MKIQRNTKMKQKNIHDIIIKLYIYQLKQYNQLKRVSYIEEILPYKKRV